MGYLSREGFTGLKKIAGTQYHGSGERVIKLFPKANFDSAINKTIELLPRGVKDDIFDMVVSLGKIDIMEDFKKNGA